MNTNMIEKIVTKIIEGDQLTKKEMKYFNNFEFPEKKNCKTIIEKARTIITYLTGVYAGI